MTDKIAVQEVRYCLRTLREQMAERQNNNNMISINASGVQADVPGHDLYYITQTQHSCRRIPGAKVMEREKKMTEMQMHMDSLKLENATLKEKLSANEAELEKQQNKIDLYEELKKQLVNQIHKNSSLDDMLKSQQRKLRNMIEQVQNARTVIDKKNTQVNDLEEKVAFLEAERNELYDRLGFQNKREQQTNNPDKGSLSPGKKPLPFMLARIKK
ncbi:tuftelin 1b [Danio aesculapii]|uniref:tuftelin 1b n=1 Tax=Danio aesculapii TaxID=1142201 RepID=UPI0024C0AC56|nr:tuftelin 1b [Danio aesculapii]